MNTVLERRVQEQLSEPRPDALVMTDSEIVEFIASNCTKVEWASLSWRITTDDGAVSNGGTFEEAVGLAAAKYEAINK